VISKMDEYLFDLQGYLVLKGAVSPTHIAELNTALEAIPRIDPGQWYGYVHREDFEASRGIAFQQIYEAGEPFERLIDHPAWIDHMKTFIGGEGTFDYTHGALFMDENFAAIRGPGEAIGLHSGGFRVPKHTQYEYRHGGFACGQVNILLSLADIGPGDGSTMVVPGSHKSNLPHPQAGEKSTEGSSVDNTAGAIEVHTKAGDAILFVDAICHGSARRVNPGERRFIVYRYVSGWSRFRFGYYPSDELLARLTPERRAIVNPFPFWSRTPNMKPGFRDRMPTPST
jgi:hypothetical protein